MPDPEVVVAWWELVIAIATVLMIAYRFFRRLDKLDELHERLAKEFGGNSGGIRQAVNALDVKFDDLSSTVSELKTSVSYMRGRCDVASQLHPID